MCFSMKGSVLCVQQNTKPLTASLVSTIKYHFCLKSETQLSLVSWTQGENGDIGLAGTDGPQGVPVSLLAIIPLLCYLVEWTYYGCSLMHINNK